MDRDAPCCARASRFQATARALGANARGAWRTSAHRAWIRDLQDAARSLRRRAFVPCKLSTRWLSRGLRGRRIKAVWSRCTERSGRRLSARHRFSLAASSGLRHQARRRLLPAVGELPWVTGSGFLQRVVTSFEHGAQRHFCVLPFHSCRRADGQLSYSEPMSLIVFDALNTVRATLHRWPVPRQQVFLSLPQTALQAPERHNSVYTFAGACQALRDQVGELGKSLKAWRSNATGSRSAWKPISPPSWSKAALPRRCGQRALGSGSAGARSHAGRTGQIVVARSPGEQASPRDLAIRRHGTATRRSGGSLSRIPQ